MLTPLNPYSLVACSASAFVILSSLRFLTRYSLRLRAPLTPYSLLTPLTNSVRFLLIPLTHSSYSILTPLTRHSMLLTHSSPLHLLLAYSLLLLLTHSLFTAY